MTTLRDNGKVEKAANGGLTEATERSYRAFVEGAFAVQEQYANLMLGWMAYGPFGGTYAEGTETNRRAVEALTEQSMRQWEASQTLAGEVLKAYASFFQVPGDRSGVRALDAGDGDKPVGEEPRLPIEDYDRLSVKEVGRRLGGLDAQEVRQIKAYEKRNKNRVTLLERLDRSLV